MLADWDIYDEGYYKFKKRYGLDNIITDLYKKDNLYIIEGNSSTANNKEIKNHIEIIVKYIKEHYNVDVKYRVVKEFSDSLKIYKLYENK